MISTEAVFAALFTKLEAVSNWTTVSRRLASAQDLQPEAFPAAYQVEDKPSFKFTPNAPSIVTLRAYWLMYVYESDKTQPLSTPLNLLIDAARVALSPPPGSVNQTLGGLVEFAAIQGDGSIVDGALTDRAIVVLPIAIVMPGF